jgi:hypothetical protein
VALLTMLAEVIPGMVRLKITTPLRNVPGSNGVLAAYLLNMSGGPMMSSPLEKRRNPPPKLSSPQPGAALISRVWVPSVAMVRFSVALVNGPMLIAPLV